MSPIFTRPYREQYEHDRIIRLLQARYRRRHEVVINPGPEQHGAVTVGELPVYPDLLLYSQEPTGHLEATVEVETGESVHLLEARAEWGVFSQVPVPFILYVPTPMLETARRIIDEQQWLVSEIWTYLPGMDQLRFVQVFKHPNPPVVVAPKLPARMKGKAAPAAQAAPSQKSPAVAIAPAGASTTRGAAQAGVPASTPAVTRAAKTQAKATAKPTPKVAAKAGAVRAATPAKSAVKVAAKTPVAKAAPSKSASKSAPAGRKTVAPAKPVTSVGKKTAGARKATPAPKKAATSAKKSVASARSAPANAASGRGGTAKKTASSGKAARRR